MFFKVTVAILLLAFVIACDCAAINETFSVIPEWANLNGNQSSSPDVPSGGRRSGWSKYVVFGDRSVDFAGALTTCRTYGLQIASITSQADTIEVQLALSSANALTGAGYWIGATNLGRPNNFLWVPSNKPIWYPNWYLNWAAGEPNNAGGAENCVEVINIIGAPWNDLNCGWGRGVVCQV